MATLWSILQPSNCLFLLLLAGLALLAARRRRGGIWLVSLSMAGFAAVLLLPIAGWLTAPHSGCGAPTRAWRDRRMAGRMAWRQSGSGATRQICDA